MTFTVCPLAPDLLSGWLDFFDQRAFADNPFWKSCYCTYYQLRGIMKERYKPAEGKEKITNRDAAVEMINAGIIRGYLYYDCGKVMGWLNANDKTMFPTLKAKEAPGEVLALMCFVVAPGSRGQGVASKLLEYSIIDARQKGFKAIEGRASLSATTMAGLHHGPKGLYEKLGFRIEGKYRNQLIYRYTFEQSETTQS